MEQNEMSNCYQEQTHVHEVLGSVRLAELRKDPHNHRFAGVTEEVMQVAPMFTIISEHKK